MGYSYENHLATAPHAGTVTLRKLQAVQKWDNNDVLLNLSDLAKIFKVTVRTIQNWRAKALIPMFVVGGTPYMTQKMLHAFIAEKGGEI